MKIGNLIEDNKIIVKLFALEIFIELNDRGVNHLRKINTD